MRIFRGLMAVITGLVLVVVLVACSSSSNGGYVHIDVGATETARALPTATLTATPGPSPTPTATPIPFVIATLDPAVDPDLVITRVGSIDITLAEFQKYVRFERFRQIAGIVRRVERHGVDQALDLTLPENETTAATFTTLADSTGFGEQVHRIMVINAIMFEEALRRGIELDPMQFNAVLAEYLGLQVGEGGQLPPEFDAEYAAYVAQVAEFSGLSEEEFRRIVRARTLYEQLEFVISNQPEALAAAQQGVSGVEVQDIVVETEELGADIAARLADGESMAAIATSLGFVAQSDAEWHTVSASSREYPAAVLAAVLDAESGQIVGPLAIDGGWYVALVGEPATRIPDPAEITVLKRQYFLDWVEARMDDPDYVIDYDNWRAYIPQEPLPVDVSPLLRDENVILPAE